MLHQACVDSGPNASQQNKVKIIVVGYDFKIIARLNLTTSPYGFWQDQLPALSDIRRHAGMIIILSN